MQIHSLDPPVACTGSFRVIEPAIARRGTRAEDGIYASDVTNVRVKVVFRQWQLWCRSRRGAGIRDARLLRYAASEMEGMTSAPAAGTTIAVARTQIRSHYPPSSSIMANFGGSCVCQTTFHIRQSYQRRPLTAHPTFRSPSPPHHSTFTTTPAITAAHRPPPRPSRLAYPTRG